MLGQQGFRIMQITLPIGISFYTFQTISYTVDVVPRNRAARARLSDFTCFVALFPHLIAGPIVRYNTIAAQFGHREHGFDRFASGIAIFILGFAKKILLANSLGRIADAVFAADAPDALTAWWGLLAYAGQIYFDFPATRTSRWAWAACSGSRSRAISIRPTCRAASLNFGSAGTCRCPASCVTILLPLGGNRFGARRSMLNLWLVMLIGGLWHGAQWKFVLWGAYHGLWLALERGSARRAGLWAFLPRPLQILVTFVLVLVAWVPFRAENWTATVAFLRALFGFGAALPTVN